jgi:hypothetical protein
MFGTLTMIALVGCGAAGISPLVVPALALCNAMVGLPRQQQAAAGPVGCRYSGLTRALPMQLIYCATGYLLGAGFSAALVWIG